MEYSDLRSLLLSNKYEQILDGCSGAEVYYLPELEAYLKIGKADGISDLGREKAALEWLSGRLIVPRVLGFESSTDGDALLISEIPGTPAARYVASGLTADTAREFVAEGARAMRAMHAIDIRDCLLDERLDVKLEHAGENVRHGLVDESDFDEDNAVKTAASIYEEVVRGRPRGEDLVFTHGDLCLPNIIMNEEVVAGFVDLGRAGVADRYQDIALFHRSFHSNCGIEVDFEGVFCDVYGIPELNRMKLDYYRKLDELF